MPKYSYICSSCNVESIFYHSMSEKMTDCESCGETHVLTKKPSKFSLGKQKKQSKVGDLVKESIREFKQDLEQEKEKIRNELYDPIE